VSLHGYGLFVSGHFVDGAIPCAHVYLAAAGEQLGWAISEGQAEGEDGAAAGSKAVNSTAGAPNHNPPPWCSNGVSTAPPVGKA
jgi:hypothetical protein